MSTRKRLTKKPNMRARYKTRVEVRQGALLLGFRVSRFGPSRARAAVTAAMAENARCGALPSHAADIAVAIRLRLQHASRVR